MFLVAVLTMIMVVIMLDRLLEVDHQYPLGYAELDRCQANAGRIIHGFEHVRDQCFQLVVKHRHGFGNGFQARIRHLEDR